MYILLSCCGDTGHVELQPLMCPVFLSSLLMNRERSWSDWGKLGYIRISVRLPVGGFCDPPILHFDWYPGVKWPERGTGNFHLASKLRLNGAILLRPLRAFMARMEIFTFYPEGTPCSSDAVSTINPTKDSPGIELEVNRWPQTGIVLLIHVAVSGTSDLLTGDVNWELTHSVLLPSPQIETNYTGCSTRGQNLGVCVGGRWKENKS